ncbi:hypothetical protein GCK72_013052 [Caenorhabditis remanei]|uniref:Uncharacterized protein n=1 Tax=Caenorhabditis remanei TaxID=31234 RepID=A0A6A5GQ51_CAERE|nr:hypothetical protein GCK72_013052 [Caenorhabditis remanei]KAF1756599.1 hypothetical protein GCK72_013052 [Caenorhabditis remanei]
MDESSNQNCAESLENASFQSSDSSKSKRPAEPSRPADEIKRGYDSPSNRHKPRIIIDLIRLHHRYRWTHQSEPRKPHPLEGGYPAVINTQQRKYASETEEVRRNPIRKALKPQNEPEPCDQSTSGHRELMDKLKAPEAKNQLSPNTSHTLSAVALSSPPIKRFKPHPSTGTAQTLRREHFTGSDIEVK